jgi:hypothetical protein
MQFNKIQAGAEYLASRSNRWRDPGTYANIARVRVLETTRYTSLYGSYVRMIAGDKGPYVKVLYLSPETGESSYPDRKASYINARQLRGLWVEAKADYDAAKAEADVAWRARHTAMVDAAAAAADLADQAARRGLPVRATLRRPSIDPGGGWEYVLSEAALKMWVGETAENGVSLTIRSE